MKIINKTNRKIKVELLRVLNNGNKKATIEKGKHIITAQRYLKEIIIK